MKTGTNSFLLIVFLLINTVMIPSNVYSQAGNVDFSGKLIYRRTSVSGEELVARTETTQYQVNIPSDSCTEVSTDGNFTATSTVSGSDIVVRHFGSGEIIDQFSWQSAWAPCFYFWIDSTTIRIKLNGVQEFVDLDIHTGNLSPFPVPPYTPPVYPQLPNRYSDQPVLPSPDQSKLLYERCLSSNSVVTDRGEVLCSGEVDWVVYDENTQQISDSITTPGGVYTDIAPYPSAAYAVWNGVSWSPDSRYLTYVETYKAVFPLRIFDTATSQILTPDFISAPVDVHRGLYWSPNSQKVAFWIPVDINNIEVESEVESLIIFDISTNSITYADEAHILTDTFQEGLWSPDNSGFVYLDINRNLVYVNVLTGATSILDTDVLSIDDWIAIVSPIADAGPDQTLTDSDDTGSELVTLDGSGSSDPDGTIESYVWSENDVEIATGINPQVSLSVGVHTIILTVTDNDGATDTDEVVITVNPPATASTLTV